MAAKQDIPHYFLN